MFERDHLMIFDDGGRPLNASFAIETVQGQRTVVLHGRWHTDHNRDYIPALELILMRLRGMNQIITEALVDSQYTRRLHLSPDQCRLPVRGRKYPLVLRNENDIKELRLALLSGIGRVGLPPNAKGGHTPLKQIRLYLGPDAPPYESLAPTLIHGLTRTSG